jgi:hypothetical protein
MARVTRSQKIIIAEDDTAIASQIALPATPSTSRPPLSQIHNKYEETMTVEDLELETELKGLKAAYKTALGVKKTKKGKNQKRGRKDMEEEQLLVALAAVEDIRQTQSSDEGSLMFLLNGMKCVDRTNTEVYMPLNEEHHNVAPPQYDTIMQQLVQQQTGQSENRDFLEGDYFRGCRTHLAFDPAIDSLYTRSIMAWASDQHAYERATVTDTYIQLAEECTSTQTDMVKDRDVDVDMLYTPIKAKTAIVTLQDIENARAEKEPASISYEVSEDSFIEQITTRSPAKLVSRIEDSVEALDNLEEALDALDEATLAQRLVSPEKKKSGLASKSTSGRVGSPTGRRRLVARTPAPQTIVAPKEPLRNPASIRGKSQTLGRRAVNPTLVEPKSLCTVKRTKSTSDLKATVRPAISKGAPLVTVVPAKKPAPRPTSLLPPKQSVRTVKPVTTSKFELPGEAVALKLRELREARKSQRGSPESSTSSTGPQAAKVKSTKPLTVPTFELPGEVVSRRKREAHETRLKAQEEEERKRREFKAKPVRKSITPSVTPRDTVASLARRSHIGISDEDAYALATGMPYSSFSIAKRSSIVGAHRPSIMAASMANTSAPRSPGNGPNIARRVSTTSGPSMTGLSVQRVASATEQKQRAKEIYQRELKALEESARQKREREAAAKKSREEAAERGRQASRDWAEKQKLKKMGEGDKGLSAGYGPGGQMGLTYKTTA